MYVHTHRYLSSVNLMIFVIRQTYTQTVGPAILLNVGQLLDSKCHNYMAVCLQSIQRSYTSCWDSRMILHDSHTIMYECYTISCYIYISFSSQLSCIQNILLLDVVYSWFLIYLLIKNNNDTWSNIIWSRNNKYYKTVILSSYDSRTTLSHHRLAWLLQ